MLSPPPSGPSLSLLHGICILDVIVRLDNVDLVTLARPTGES